MKVIAFLTDYSVVDTIINHPKLKFVADKPPPTHRAYQEVLMAAEAESEYFSDLLFAGEERSGQFPRFLSLSAAS
jgi:hypothetical protein